MPGPDDPNWQALDAHRDTLSSATLSALFESDPTRAERYRLSAAGVLLDYSKNLVTDDTLNLLGTLASAESLPDQIRRLFNGDKVNVTEQRAALHTLLRAGAADKPVGLEDEHRAVQETLAKMTSMAQRVRSGEWKGASGKPIRQVIHIGIGGSYLGPRMLAEALTPYNDARIDCHYVANVDGHHIDSVIGRLDPEETLVIVVSKTFTTLETRLNASTTRQWLLTRVPEAQLARHLIAVTSNVDAATEFGISEENILPMWDWVGGRYSLWSAVGLPIALTFGFDVFQSVLDGAAAMDRHFHGSLWPENMPLMLAMLGVWYHNFLGAATHVVLPYDHNLRLLPAHLQQLDMESNGKSVTLGGHRVRYDTGPIVWGGEGTNGQHAFHQLLHQGTRLVSTDFILPLEAHHERQEHHDWLVSNCLAQSQALMLGRSTEEPYRTMPGSRPSNTLIVDRITPESVGALVALYEHKVFCQAAIWHINPFDQWGVELGKTLGETIHARIVGESNEPSRDPSTESLIRLYTQHRGQ